MVDRKPKVTAHMVVKNEDSFVYFAIKSILPFVDHILITDTGSTDNTVEIINGMLSDKITFDQVRCTTSQEVTAVRQAQLDATKTDWLWIIDGDEVYPDDTAREVVAAIGSAPQLEGVVVRRYDLLGDIYHAQDERVGEYQLFGERGHLVLRAINKSAIRGLHLSGSYPLEGYYDQAGNEITSHDPKHYYITKHRLYHAAYLNRSSQGNNPVSVINRGKYKIEVGKSIKAPLPRVFGLKKPISVGDPTLRRSWLYEALAYLITPIKQIKRKYL